MKAKKRGAVRFLKASPRRKQKFSLSQARDKLGEKAPMPIYLKDIVANPKILKERRGTQQKCCECQIVLHEALTGKRKAPKGYACSDCYYDLLGAEIEANPIASAGVRRG